MSETNEVDTPLPLPGVTKTRRKRSKHRVRSRHERAGRRAGVPVRQISLSVPSSLAERWRSFSQAKQHSLVDVMLDAIVAHKKDLSELVRAQQRAARTDSAPISDGTFLRTSTEPRHDPFVTIPLRLLSTNVDTLDALSYETAAESRSQLVVAALTAFLPARTLTEAPGP